MPQDGGNSLSVFPNPAKDQLNIHMAGKATGQVTVIIRNAAGATVTFTMHPAGAGIRFDGPVFLGGLPAGLYIAKTTWGPPGRRRQKIVEALGDLPRSQKRQDIIKSEAVSYETASFTLIHRRSTRRICPGRYRIKDHAFLPEIPFSSLRDQAARCRQSQHHRRFLPLTIAAFDKTHIDDGVVMDEEKNDCRPAALHTHIFLVRR